jgi:hypothetical protein
LGGQHTVDSFKVLKDIKSVEIDPSQIMADIDRENNIVEIED